MPHLFEVVFGDNDRNPDHGLFHDRRGTAAVRLQGTIDRVDLVETADGVRFRVIDYKTGTPPSAKDVTSFLMVQLPLYAPGGRAARAGGRGRRALPTWATGA